MSGERTCLAHQRAYLSLGVQPTAMCQRAPSRVEGMQAAEASTLDMWSSGREENIFLFLSKPRSLWHLVTAALEKNTEASHTHSTSCCFHMIPPALSRPALSAVNITWDSVGKTTARSHPTCTVSNVGQRPAMCVQGTSSLRSTAEEEARQEKRGRGQGTARQGAGHCWQLAAPDSRGDHCSTQGGLA